MSQWNPESLRSWFAAVAQNAKNQLEELAPKIQRGEQRQTPRIRDTYDEHLAKWALYDSLARSTSWASRESLIDEAAAMLAAGPGPSAFGAFTLAVFRQHWQSYLQAFIEEYKRDRGAH